MCKAVHPGFVQADLLIKVPQPIIDMQNALIPAEKRLERNDDAVQIVDFLFEESSRWVNAQANIRLRMVSLCVETTTTMSGEQLCLLHSFANAMSAICSSVKIYHSLAKYRSGLSCPLIQEFVYSVGR